MTAIQLSVATIFADLNKNEAQLPTFERVELNIHPLKYKHFRSVMQYPEADQMHHLMLALTGLSEDDLGELCPADAARVSAMVFDSMKDYMQLGQKIMRNVGGKS